MKKRERMSEKGEERPEGRKEGVTKVERGSVGWWHEGSGKKREGGERRSEARERRVSGRGEEEKLTKGVDGKKKVEWSESE